MGRVDFNPSAFPDTAALAAGRICPVDGAVCNYDDGGAAIFAIDLGLRLNAIDAGRPVV